ncbi:MAG TPA: TetR/AcrR family transcriptional regulator, partial [Desulfobacteraceae bacterium]|nr:TetR/AcrR family transcriptional regulator [Desulfobacteraceae bacterium]
MRRSGLHFFLDTEFPKVLLIEHSVNSRQITGRKIMRKNQKAEVRKPEILEHYYQVLINEGFEGASIGKIAKRMNIHPSLIIHYFKTKENMTLELVKALIDRYEAPEYLQFDHIQDPLERFKALMDTLFSLEWSRTVDPGVHFGFYYLSFRNPEVKKRFEEMIKRLRDHLIRELERFRRADVVKVDNALRAADMIVTLIEGLEFH